MQQYWNMTMTTVRGLIFRVFASLCLYVKMINFISLSKATPHILEWELPVSDLLPNGKVHIAVQRNDSEEAATVKQRSITATRRRGLHSMCDKDEARSVYDLVAAWRGRMPLMLSQ